MMKKNLNACKVIYLVSTISLLFAASGLRAEERLPASVALSERTKEFLSDPARTGSLLGSILAGAAVANPLAPLVGSVAGFLIGKSSAFSNKDNNATRRQAYANRSLMPEDGLQVTSLTGLTGTQSPMAEQVVIAGFSENNDTEVQSAQTEQATIAGLSAGTGTAIRLEQTEQTASRFNQTVIAELPAGTGHRPTQTDHTLIVGLPEDTGADDQQEHQTASPEFTGHTGPGSKLQQQLAYACNNAQLAQSMSSSCYYYSQ